MRTNKLQTKQIKCRSENATVVCKSHIYYYRIKSAN